MSKKQIITILIVVLLSIIIGAIIFTNSRNNDGAEINTDTSIESYPSKTGIENLSAIKNSVDDESITDIKSRLLTWIQANNPESKYSNVKGKIREESVKRETSSSVNKLSFVFDETDLKQSYRVEVSRSNTDTQTFVYIFCVNESERIYPSFDCKDFNSL